MQADCTAQIPLRARDGRIRAFAIIDAADADWVNQWKWYLSDTGYVKRRTPRRDGRQRNVPLHRELLGLVSGDGKVVDHIDHNRLNCRRSNLRVVTSAQNNQNKLSKRGSASQYRGVTWHKAAGKWMAQVMVGRRYTYLGLFTEEAEAARASSDARKRLMPYSVEHLLTT